MNPLNPKKRINLIPRGEKGKCRWCNGEVPRGRTKWCSQACVDDALIRTQPSYARRKVYERDKGVCADCGLDTDVLKTTLHRIGVLAKSGMLGYCRTSDKAGKRYGLTPGRIHQICSADRTDWEAAEKEKRDLELFRKDPIQYPMRQRTYWGKPLPVTPAEQRIRVVHRRLMKLAGARLAAMGADLRKRGFTGPNRNGTLIRSLWDADHILPVVKGGGGCGLENYRTLCEPDHKRRTRELAAERAAARKLERDGPTPPPHPELF